MKMSRKFRGNDIELINGKYVFSDTKELISETYKQKTCGNCGRHYTAEGHDGCLGTLKGIMNACCGHGNVNEAYVQFLDGYCVRKEDAIIILEILKKYRDNGGN